MKNIEKRTMLEMSCAVCATSLERTMLAKHGKLFVSHSEIDGVAGRMDVVISRETLFEGKTLSVRVVMAGNGVMIRGAGLC